ncbi:MAG: winged helix-turn-helix transcriptional regulator [Alphaproteobacteria bacterium]|nr:winged helix-turn-helix transcriptional regulator [Alphaproteobacteria bacterium]
MPSRTGPSHETTIEVRDGCLCLHVQRAARALARRFDAAFRDIGLSQGQFSLMMALNRPAPPPLGPLADFLAMDRTTLTAYLKVLTARGWVDIATDADDKRVRRPSLTAAGRAALNAAVPIWRATHAELDRELGETRVDTMRKSLRLVA